MNDLVIAELFRRIIELEARVDAIEGGASDDSLRPLRPLGSLEEGGEREAAAGTGESASETSASLRKRAIEALETEIGRLDPGATLRGSRNRGAHPLSIVAGDGSAHRVYLSSSRNYVDDAQQGFSSWHTITTADIGNDAFEAFLLAPFNERNEPEFFVFTSEQMREITRSKRASRGYFHFYISPADTAGEYVDHRSGRDDSAIDLTRYRNAWHSLPLGQDARR